MKEKSVLKKVLIVGGSVLLGTAAVLFGKKALSAKKDSTDDGYFPEACFTPEEE